MVDELIKYDKAGVKSIIKYYGNNILARSVKVDDSGNLWVATFSNGLLQVKNGQVIKSWNNSNGLLSNIVQQFAIDGNYIWIVTSKGIQQLDLKKSSFKT